MIDLNASEFVALDPTIKRGHLIRWFKEGASVRQISKAIDMTPQGVTHHLISAGVYETQNNEVPQDQVDKILEMRQNGATNKEISDKLNGIKIDRIQYICKKFKVKASKETISRAISISQNSEISKIKEQLLNDRKNGLTFKELENKYNINPNTLKDLVKKSGIRMDPMLAQQHVREGIREFHEPNRQKIITSYSPDKTVTELAAELGVTRQTVSHVLDKIGLRIKREVHLIPEDVASYIAQLRLDGFAFREIAAKTGLSVTSIRHMCVLKNIKLTKEQHIKNIQAALNKLSQEVKDLMAQDRRNFMTIRNISKKYNISYFAARHYLKPFNIKMPKEIAQQNAYQARLEINPNCMAEMRAEGADKPSKGELEVNAYVLSILPSNEIPSFYNPETGSLSTRKILPSGKELDIYIPSRNFALEYNGLFTHSEAAYELRESLKNKFEKNYHRNKFYECRDLNINLFSIFEDEWFNKKALVKAMIKWRLGLFDGIKLDARKLELLKLYNNSDYKYFFDTNHIDGHTRASYAYALKYNNNIVMCASVRLNRQNKIEIARLATDYNFTVRGGAQRLLKHIRNEINQPLYSYSNNRIGTGNVYKKAGFEFDKEIKPSYFYTDLKIRIKRENCQRITHPEVMSVFPTEKTQARGGVFSKKHKLGHEKPMYAIYDSGHTEWILK